MWQQLSGDEAMHGQIPAAPQQLGMVAWRDTTVEDLVAIVQNLPHREPVVPAVMHGCFPPSCVWLAPAHHRSSVHPPESLAWVHAATLLWQIDIGSATQFWAIPCLRHLQRSRPACPSWQRMFCCSDIHMADDCEGLA